MQRPRAEIWVENIAELKFFIHEFLRGGQRFNIQGLFVAKGGIGRRYLSGKYREYSHVEEDVLDTRVTAPAEVVDLVQWCCPDIIFTKNGRPIFSLEITFHEPTWNNVAQRLPRLARAAACGVPSIIFHKCSPENPYKSWVAEQYRKVSQLYKVYSLPLFFCDADYEKKKSQLVNICNDVVEQTASFPATMKKLLQEVTAIAKAFSQDNLEFDSRGLRRRWLPRITNDLVEVRISVQQQCGFNVCGRKRCRTASSRAKMTRKIRARNRRTEHGCMWLTKGTGGLDPYPGLVKLVDMLCCYTESGKKIKSLLVNFAELPEDFWWFEKHPNSLYYRLIKEFADEIVYKGQSRVLFSQSSMIIRTRKFLSSHGWTVLYDDLPGGSRSGIGDRNKLFQIFTRLFRSYPDLVCVRGDKLLIVEVNDVLSEAYVRKLNSYLHKSELLKKELTACCDRTLKKIDVGFGRIRGRYTEPERDNAVRRFFQDNNMQVYADN